MSASYDVIVLGVGAMGASAAMELSRRGRRVLGLEQFHLVHDRGSSHGQTRVIRKAYYEHPNYVPLLCRAYERWYDLEQLVGKRLFTECGCLTVGPPAGEMVQGVQASAREHGLPIEVFAGPTEVRRRFPAFHVDEDMVGVFERDAGFLMVEECIQACVDQARAAGAELHEYEPVQHWEAAPSGIRVDTERGRYTAARLIITAGAWAARALSQLGLPLTLMRQVLGWFGTSDASLFRRDRFPCYLIETPTGYFYGFPAIDGNGAKVAQHYGAPELRHPEEIDRTPNAADEASLRRFLERYLPRADGPLRQAKVCTYTLTPDRHFVLDLHPAHANVAIAAGFSGHGFKFASVIGEILADLADEGQTRLPIEMFRVGRFG